MNKRVFSRISESLRQYRRAELRDFALEIGSNPVDALYVDPLPDNAVLNSVTSSNTTFLLGRKGTGKSTVFAKAQSELRRSESVISAYIDVKALADVLPTDTSVVTNFYGDIDQGIIRAHMLRKFFLGKVISELLTEVAKAAESMKLVDRFLGRGRSYRTLHDSLAKIAEKVKSPELEEHEIPSLRTISNKWKSQHQAQQSTTSTVGAEGSVGLTSASATGSASVADFDKTLEDLETYKEYSENVLQAFPFFDLLTDIKELLKESNLLRLVIFLDDFSELPLVDQKLFVDVVLSTLNNSSNEAVKLKVAGYPGRVYFGKIDPSKIDIVSLDFSDLYEANEVQEMEACAIDYASRLLRKRFDAFGGVIEEYFDPKIDLDQHLRLIFETTFNVPRLIGSLLHTCYLDRISKGDVITASSLKLASRKYYESTISQYFDQMFRYALEPFENKLDRFNQKELLGWVLSEIKVVRDGIRKGQIGGSYFKDIPNPPVSHFVVDSQLEGLFQSLESNFLISRYKSTRGKDGNALVVFALHYGVIEANKMTWGYPPGRNYRNYFVQRCFDYTKGVQQFLSDKKTIQCNLCSTCFPMDQKSAFEIFAWKCPNCNEGKCSITELGSQFEIECNSLKVDSMLEPVELEILSVLKSEGRHMRAGEIALLLDTSYQLIGRRTSKLEESDLVEKIIDAEDGHKKSKILDKAIKQYF